MFSRFYARACRNYCLALHPVEKLIITEASRQKNPTWCAARHSARNSTTPGHYRHLLESIPIYLNTDQSLGIKGAAIHAWLKLSAHR